MKQGWLAALVLTVCLLAVPARAEDTDTSIRLTPDATRIIRLEQDAASVIVANPEHASVVLDSPRLVVVMPRLPGTTLFTVLNARGETILEKIIIVAGTAKPEYVRIRRSCAAGGGACVPDSYYYCPDGCYEVTPVRNAQDVQAPPLPNAGGTGAPIGEDMPPPALPQASDSVGAPVTGGNGQPAPPGGGSTMLPPSEAGGAPQVAPPGTTTGAPQQ